MSITINKDGFDTASLDTSNGAEMHAALTDDRRHFDVSMGDGGEGWYFDVAACDQAIEFFCVLRDELARRELARG